MKRIKQKLPEDREAEPTSKQSKSVKEFGNMLEAEGFVIRRDAKGKR